MTPKIKSGDKDYDLYQLFAEANAQLGNLLFVDVELQRPNPAR
jgi:hypothetical protein